MHYFVLLVYLPFFCSDDSLCIKIYIKMLGSFKLWCFIWWILNANGEKFSCRWIFIFCPRLHFHQEACILKMIHGYRKLKACMSSFTTTTSLALIRRSKGFVIMGSGWWMTTAMNHHLVKCKQAVKNLLFYNAMAQNRSYVFLGLLGGKSLPVTWQATLTSTQMRWNWSN